MITKERENKNKMKMEIHLQVIKKINNLINFKDLEFINECNNLINWIQKNKDIDNTSKLGYIYFIMKSHYKDYITKNLEKEKKKNENGKE